MIYRYAAQPHYTADMGVPHRPDRYSNFNFIQKTKISLINCKFAKEVYRQPVAGLPSNLTMNNTAMAEPHGGQAGGPNIAAQKGTARCASEGYLERHCAAIPGRGESEGSVRLQGGQNHRESAAWL